MFSQQQYYIGYYSKFLSQCDQANVKRYGEFKSIYDLQLILEQVSFTH